MYTFGDSPNTHGERARDIARDTATDARAWTCARDGDDDRRARAMAAPRSERARLLTSTGDDGKDRCDDLERGARVDDGARTTAARRTGWAKTSAVCALVIGAVGACAVAVSIGSTTEADGGRFAQTAALGENRFASGGRTRPVCSREHPGYSAPYVGLYENIGEWPESYLRWDLKCAEKRKGEAELGKLYVPTKHYRRPNQKEINEFMRAWSASFGRAYEVPPNGKKKGMGIEIKDSSPMVYDFVHVPKAGGTYFTELMIRANDAIGEKHGYPYKLRDAPFSNFVTLPLIDATQQNAHATLDAFKKGQPEQYFSKKGLQEKYDKGQRMFVKGQFGMGMCDAVEAPCMYFTVLRDPVERYLSHYKYSCLAGAEGKAQWTEEWIKLGNCPLDPIELMTHLGINLDWTVELAPGAKNGDLHRTADVAKQNLDSKCMRYLITEHYADGLQKVTKSFPDFSDAVRRLHNANGNAENKAKKLPPPAQERFDAYMKNATIMKAIRERHALMQGVYDHALKNYEANWNRPIVPC